MHTRKIVGWSMRQILHTEIALDALIMPSSASGPRRALSTTPTGVSNKRPRPTAKALPQRGLPRR